AAGSGTEGTGSDAAGPGAGGGAASGVDLARAALAAARAQARKRPTDPKSKAARRDAVTRRSGARPDDRDPQPLGATIERLLTERGWEAPAAVAGVVGRWDQIVGDQLAAHCQPESFTDGEVVVRADSTAWATQLRLLAADLV